MRTPTRATLATLATTGLLALVPATSGAASTKAQCGDEGYTNATAAGVPIYAVFAKNIRTRHYRCGLGRKLAVSISRRWFTHQRLPRGWALLANPAPRADGGQLLIFERDRRRGATQRISFVLSTQTFPTG